jgi:hypothetical protein
LISLLYGKAGGSQPAKPAPLLTAAATSETEEHPARADCWLQVAEVLDAASQYLREQLLDSHPCVVLRVALDLQLAGLQAAIESTFLQVTGCPGMVRCVH